MGGMRNLKRGQTIVGEREWAESDSERVQARKKMRRRSFLSVIAVILMVVILGLLAYMGARAVVTDARVAPEETEAEYKIQAEIVDESGDGQISSRMRKYIGQLEQDFKDAGYVVKRVTLPTGMSRSLYVDLEGETCYLKVTMDRDAAVTVEDAARMLKFTKETNAAADYVDVRVEGKAYYK